MSWGQISPGLRELPELRARLPLAWKAVLVLMAQQEQVLKVRALRVPGLLERTRLEPERSVLLVLRALLDQAFRFSFYFPPAINLAASTAVSTISLAELT